MLQLLANRAHGVSRIKFVLYLLGLAFALWSNVLAGLDSMLGFLYLFPLFILLT